MSTAARSTQNSRAVSRATSVAPTSKRSSSQWGGAPPPAPSTGAGSIAGPYAPSMTRTNSTQSSVSNTSYAERDRGRDRDKGKGGSKAASKLADVLSSVWGGQSGGTAPPSARPSRPASPPSAMPGSLDFAPSETPRGFEQHTRTPTARHSRASAAETLQPAEIAEQLSALDSAPAWPFDAPAATEPSVAEEIPEPVVEAPEEPPAAVEEPPAPEPEPERVVTPEPVVKSKRGSKIPTPKKGATPAPTVPASKVATPAPTAPASKAPTPAATPSVSKAASRRASKKGTPIETRAQSPIRQSASLPPTEEEPIARALSPAPIASPKPPSAVLESVAENEFANHNDNGADFFDTLAAPTTTDARSPVDGGFEYVENAPIVDHDAEMPDELADMPPLGTGTGAGLGGGLLSLGATLPNLSANLPNLGANLPNLGGWGSPPATTPPVEKPVEKKEEKKGGGLLGGWGWGGSKKEASPPPAPVPAATPPAPTGWGAAKPAANAGWGANKTGSGFGATKPAMSSTPSWGSAAKSPTTVSTWGAAVENKPEAPNPSLSRGASLSTSINQPLIPSRTASPAPQASTPLPEAVSDPLAAMLETPAVETTADATAPAETAEHAVSEPEGHSEAPPTAEEGGEVVAPETREAPEDPVDTAEAIEPAAADAEEEWGMPVKKAKGKKAKKGALEAEPEAAPAEAATAIGGADAEKDDDGPGGKKKTKGGAKNKKKK